MFHSRIISYGTTIACDKISSITKDLFQICSFLFRHQVMDSFLKIGCMNCLVMPMLAKMVPVCFALTQKEYYLNVSAGNNYNITFLFIHITIWNNYIIFTHNYIKQVNIPGEYNYTLSFLCVFTLIFFFTAAISLSFDQPTYTVGESESTVITLSLNHGITHDISVNLYPGKLLSSEKLQQATMFLHYMCLSTYLTLISSD